MPLKVAGVVVFVLILLYLFLPRFLPSLFTSIAGPFWGIEKNSLTKPELMFPELQNATLTELQKENGELKRLLEMRISSSSLVAYVLKRPPFSAYDAFIISAGSKVGVKNGAKVFAIGNVLIGEIAEVSPTTSKVKLYSSYGEKYEVFIGPKNIQAAATGRGGGSFEVVLPRDVKIQEGDSITIPHLTTSVFGIVRKIIADPARAFSTILFSQPINIYEQKWVEIDQ